MKSMTGYGRAILEDNNIRLEAELRCVNGRVFSLSTRIPQEFCPYESDMKQMIVQKITRGSVYLNLYYQDSATSEQKINEPLLKRYFEELSRIAQSFHAAPPPLGSLLHLPGITQPNMISVLPDERWAQAKEVLLQALENIEKMRLKEGSQIQIEIAAYIRQIDEFIQAIQKSAPLVVTNYQERLKKRLTDLLNNENFRFSPEDILKEVAIFTEKADISEEISRLKSHAQHLQELLSKEEPVGKTMEFVLQEMVRESNTIAAKANDLDCSRATVNIKNSVEKIREQIQNVE